MDSIKSSKKFVPVSLVLLLCASSGIAINMGVAEAKPPRHAPAWGYRCKNDDRAARSSNVDCQKNRDRNDRDEDRDDDDRYDDDRDDDRSSGTISDGTVLYVEYTGSRRITIPEDERYSLTLRVTRDIRNSDNRVLIPRGSKVDGEFRPSGDGVRFVADTLTLPGGTRYRIDATSRVINDNGDLASLPSRTISDAARIVIGSVLGTDRDSRDNSDVIVLTPGRDLELTLRSDLRVR
ncbi:MAG: hypothetical protein KME08_02695 [Aphanothece sp. CMT-3BRIN-NPC111]|jgi:hypothetical protein|nr:hypothetical protein [Aphanothece sp. CMT-3BRIN-NPC111]